VLSGDFFDRAIGRGVFALAHWAGRGRIAIVTAERPVNLPVVAALVAPDAGVGGGHVRFPLAGGAERLLR
jgi:hypothetical protein